MTKKSGLAITHFHRRRYPRIDMILPVEYTLDESPASIFAQSRAIGGGGLMLLLPVAVETGSVMRLNIHFPGHVNIYCAARVVWTELLTGLECSEFKTGVKFEEISEHDLKVLRNFIKEQQNPFDLPDWPPSE